MPQPPCLLRAASLPPPHTRRGFEQSETTHSSSRTSWSGSEHRSSSHRTLARPGTCPSNHAGREGIDALGACSCIGSDNSRSRWMDSLTFLIARRFSVLARSAAARTMSAGMIDASSRRLFRSRMCHRFRSTDLRSSKNPLSSLIRFARRSRSPSCVSTATMQNHKSQ